MVCHLPPPLLNQLAVVSSIVGQGSPRALRAVTPGHLISLTPSRHFANCPHSNVFSNIDLSELAHLLLVQRAMVGPAAGATLVKAPPLLSCSPPTSGVSSPQPAGVPAAAAGWWWWYSTAVTAAQRLSRPHNGLWSAPRICTRPACTRDTMVHCASHLDLVHQCISAKVETSDRKSQW